LPFRIAYKIAYKTPTRHQLQWDMNYGWDNRSEGIATWSSVHFNHCLWLR